MAHTQWSPDAVIEAIQARHNDRLPLAWLIVKKREPDLLFAAEKFFGSWSKAIVAAGFDLRHTYWSSEKYFHK